ncbi:leucine-rich repeat protein, putative [Bodo saltans]|uniref:Leucine-rich repeat protein, putative n=1 Tax=Bodo saltans TaxID=75058 RepID=A0A0S4IHD7_BODSA|nr:leucine-rich repeat protein, putative [Bodo saltans]|eukprot:CUE64076.1 leucine-rich repeat protein, putative [Bodo saltans]
MSRDFVELRVGDQPRALLSFHAWSETVDAMLAVGRLDGGRLTQYVRRRGKSSDVSTPTTAPAGITTGTDDVVARNIGRRFLRLGDSDSLLRDEITLALSTTHTGVPLCRRICADLLRSNAQVSDKRSGVESSNSSEIANAELDSWWSRALTMATTTTAATSSSSGSSKILSSSLFSEWRDEDIVIEYMKLALVRDLEVLFLTKHQLATACSTTQQQSDNSNALPQLSSTDDNNDDGVVGGMATVHLHDCVMFSETSGDHDADDDFQHAQELLAAKVRRSYKTLSSFVVSFSTSSPKTDEEENKNNRGGGGGGSAAAAAAAASSRLALWLCKCFLRDASPVPPISATTFPFVFGALQRLSLVNVCLGDHGSAALFRSVLPSTPLLARLELCNIGCGELGATCIGELFAGESCASLCQSLRVLELAGNPIGRSGAMKILNGLVLGCRAIATAAPTSGRHYSPQQRTSSPRRRLQPTQPETVAAQARRRDPVASVSSQPPPPLFLQSLDLTSTAIGENPPEELFVLLKHLTFSSLRSLRLGNNNLGLCGARWFSAHMSGGASSASAPSPSPGGKGAGGGLEVLDVRGNRLGDGGVVALSKALIAMSRSLRVLNLADNRIETIGGAALASVLHRGLPQLESLCLEGNHKLGDTSWAAIGAAMSSGLLPRLGELELASSGIPLTMNSSQSALSPTSTSHAVTIGVDIATAVATTTIPSVALAVAQGLRVIAPQLGRLNLDNVSLADRGAVSLLATAIRRMRNLQALSLKRCELRDDHMLVLCETGLAHTAGSLQQLWLDGNLFSAAGMRHIGHQLEQMSQRLSLMSFADVLLGGQGGAELGGCMDIATNLEVLRLSQTRLGDLCMAALGEGLAFLPRLKELWLDQNAISPMGLVDLLAPARATTTTSVIEFFASQQQHQQPLVSPPSSISASLECRWMGRHLRVLSLKNNPIGDGGVLALCSNNNNSNNGACLESCVHLTHLDLSFVGFEEAGLKSLCGLLQRWTDNAARRNKSQNHTWTPSLSHPLESLDVSGNGTHLSPDEAFAALLSAILYSGSCEQQLSKGGPPSSSMPPTPFSSLVFLNASMGSSALMAPFSAQRSRAEKLRQQFCEARRFVAHQCLPIIPQRSKLK